MYIFNASVIVMNFAPNMLSFLQKGIERDFLHMVKSSTQHAYAHIIVFSGKMSGGQMEVCSCGGLE